MRAAVFLHGAVCGGVIVDFDTLDQLKEVAGQHLGITVGSIFNDSGAIIVDVRHLMQGTILYVTPIAAREVCRGRSADGEGSGATRRGTRKRTQSRDTGGRATKRVRRVRERDGSQSSNANDEYSGKC